MWFLLGAFNTMHLNLKTLFKEKTETNYYTSKSKKTLVKGTCVDFNAKKKKKKKKNPLVFNNII